MITAMMDGTLPIKLPMTVAVPAMPITIASVCSAYTTLATVTTDGIGSTLPCWSTAAIASPYRRASDEAGIHRLAIVQIQPALHDAVNRPNRDHRENEPADQDHRGDHAGDPADQSEPKRSDLPVEMRLQPSVARRVDLDVIDDDARNPGDPDDKADRLQNVHEQCEVA